MEVRLMRVGLISDTHDRLPAIIDLVKLFADRGITLVMHAGDYCSPFALDPFHDASMPLLGIFGRNDGDHEGLKAHASQAMATELHDSPHSFDVSGHRILLVHDLGEVNKRSIESHEFVVHGMTHRQQSVTRGRTLVVNPGEACGWLTGRCTAAVLDLETGELEIVSL
jgi:putative phosphoesterase